MAFRSDNLSSSLQMYFASDSTYHRVFTTSYQDKFSQKDEIETVTEHMEIFYHLNCVAGLQIYNCSVLESPLRHLRDVCLVPFSCLYICR